MEQLLNDSWTDCGAGSQKLGSSSAFLKDRILARITSVQVLCTGNTSEQAATDFCQEHIIGKLPIATELTGCSEKKLQVRQTTGSAVPGSVYWDCITPSKAQPAAAEEEEEEKSATTPNAEEESDTADTND